MYIPSFCFFSPALQKLQLPLKKSLSPPAHDLPFLGLEPSMYNQTAMKNSKTYTMSHRWTIPCLCLLFTVSLTATHVPKTWLDPIKDQILAVRGSATVFDVLPQRGTREAVLRVGLVEEPRYGSVAFFGTDSMEYRPQEVDCGQTDRFVYFVETNAGRKEVEVTAEILCESLTIISGFSPDGDGINDTFTILGVENYPDNRLTIFNKWGEKIFQAKGYQNDWDGTDEQGRPLYLEDGLFYYVFEDGRGKTYSGYVQVKL